jgi:hypothetical protein
MITGIWRKVLVVLDQRAGLVAIQARHHDVDEDDVGLVVGDLGQRVEAVDRGEHLAALLREQRFGGAPDRLAVVDDEHLEPVQLLGGVIRHVYLHASGRRHRLNF